jgi:hypothetical protein
MYMYVQAADYYDDLRKMRAEASKIVGNVRKTIAEKPTYEFKISRYKDDVDWEDEGKGHVSLHFSMPDFYLKGIQNMQMIHFMYLKSLNSRSTNAKKHRY